VVILEKETLPRVKPCGGAMPGGMKQFFDWDISEVIESEVAVQRNLLNYEREAMTRTHAPILFVNRSRFDQHLVERALRLGAGRITLREGFVMRDIEEDGGVTLRSSKGESIRARYVIAADGATSRTARTLKLNVGRKIAAAVDAEVVVTPEVFAIESQRVTFNFFCLQYGYGWIFPKANGLLACGIGGWDGEYPLPTLLKTFLARSLPAGSILSVKEYGHGIPLYETHRQIATSRVCLVGDAASLVEPIMGEGIRFALISGRTAAGVIMQLIGVLPVAHETIDRFGDCRAYQSIIHEGIGTSLYRLAKLIQPVFLQAPEYFYEKFIVQGGSYYGAANAVARQFTFLDSHAPPV
jgi:geranylgeranyl reductase family protein